MPPGCDCAQRRSRQDLSEPVPPVRPRLYAAQTGRAMHGLGRGRLPNLVVGRSCRENTWAGRPARRSRWLKLAASHSDRACQCNDRQCVRSPDASSGHGRVQGVGFRPFVYRLAKAAFGIGGEVQQLYVGEVEIHCLRRSPDTLALEFSSTTLIAGGAATVEAAHCTRSRYRPNATAYETVLLFTRAKHGQRRKRIRAARLLHVRRTVSAGASTTRPTGAIGYPFINCTQCGPRYTLIEATALRSSQTRACAAFALCADCEQRVSRSCRQTDGFMPNPSPARTCGPSVEYVDDRPAVGSDGDSRSRCGDRPPCSRAESLPLRASAAITCCATQRTSRRSSACAERKRRPDKPLAVLFPFEGDAGLDALREHVELRERETDALLSSARPIVLAARREDSRLPDNLAPGSGRAGRVAALLAAAPPAVSHLRATAGGDVRQHQRRTGTDRQRRSGAAPGVGGGRIPASRPTDRAAGR